MTTQPGNVGNKTARAAFWKKHARKLKIGVGLGLACGLIVMVLGFSKEGFLQRTELLSLDVRYRARPQIPIHPEVGLINYDDASLALFGGWPWPRHRQVALVTVLDMYDARAAGYDVFFSERNDIVLMGDRIRQFVRDTTIVPGPSAATRVTRTMRTAIRDYDREFEKAIQHAGNIYLGYFVEEPDKTIAAGGLTAIQQYIDSDKVEWTDVKREAMEALKPYTIEGNPELEKGIFKMSDVTPPLPGMTRAASGVGFAQIVKDLDHTVRLYPMFMYYDGRICPSIGCVMVSRILGVPLDKWKIHPGRYVELPDAQVPGQSAPQTIRIPVNDNGQMLMNWAARFDDVFLHVPFRLISEYYAYHTAKTIARNFPADPAQYDVIRREIQASIDEEQMVTEDESARIAGEIALSHVVSPMIREGKSSAAQILSGIPRDVQINSRTQNVLTALEMAIIRSETELIERNRIFPPTPTVSVDSAWASEVSRNVDWFSAKGRLADVEPLYFPPTRKVNWDGRMRDFSPIDLENKIFMIGLTGVGTIDLNPMPYEHVSPMVGLHSNALNTMLVRRFISFPKDLWRVPLDLGFAVITALIGTLTTPFIGFLGVLLLAGAYSYSVYWAFAEYGQWIYWVEPVLAILLTYLAVVVFHFIEAQREKGRVRALFAALVSPAVLKLMEENPDRFSLTGVRKSATTFFSAIENFGRVTAGVPPDELGGILSIYLTPTSEIIMDYDGYIDKYEAHIIMADFGVPLDDSGHAWKCCYASLEQQQDIRPFQYFVRARYGADVYTTMGVNTGYISAGNMGSEKKMQYTVMGDAVNMAARFRPANLIYDTRIIIGEPTVPYVGEYLELRMLDKLLAKGKTKPTTIYEVQGWKPEAYLKGRGMLPIPSSVLTRWSKCPPEKVFGYQLFWAKREKEFPHPLIPKVRGFFESQLPRAGEWIQLEFARDLRKHRAEWEWVRAEAAKVLGRTVDGAAPAGASWDRVMSAWVETSSQVVEELKGKSGTAGDPALLGRADILKHRLEALERRLSQEFEEEEQMGRIAAGLRRHVEQPADGADVLALDARVESMRSAYRSETQAFYSTLTAEPVAYHEMMSQAGSLTPPRKQARDIFEQAVNIHWERKWEESMAGFRKVLEIIPDDGPSLSYLQRIEGYKTDPPGEKWQGEFVQKKK